MAGKATLEATMRDGTGKGAARQARREGLVPGVVYGGGQDPISINVKHNVLLKELKAGKFLSRLIGLQIDGTEHLVICRSVQRDVVRDLPIHIDFLRLSETSRINLFIPVEFINHAACPGIKKGGVLTVVRPEVELKVPASAIPDHLTVDLTGLNLNDTIKISNVTLPAGVAPVIADRDFVIANISVPSGLLASDDEDGGDAEE